MSISRRAVLHLAAASLALRAAGASAQRAAEPARIGWLSYARDPDPGLANLRVGLQEIGLTEGRSYVFVPRFANDDFTRLPKLVEELGQERLKLLVARGPSVDYTKPIRGQVPVVFIYSGDPIAAGFADSLAKPGRNMTGVTFMALELSAKRMAVLKELIPQASSVALLSNPEHAGELAEYQVTDDTARRLGVNITRYIVRSPQQLPEVFEQIVAARHDAMLVFPDFLTLTRRAQIAEFAARARIPAVYGWTEFAESGGLLSYGARLSESFKILAKFIDQILKGSQASTIPIEQASRVNLTLNIDAVRNLGLQVPPSILAQADQVSVPAAGSTAAPK